MFYNSMDSQLYCGTLVQRQVAKGPSVQVQVLNSFTKPAFSIIDCYLCQARGCGWCCSNCRGRRDFLGGGTNDIFGNKKQTMQNLNDRLVSYLDKVRALETANTELELKIKEWYDKNPGSLPGKVKDYSKYNAIIEDLKAKVFKTITDNAAVRLLTDNARLAAADFKMKYESELDLRHTVEEDINGLHRVLDELNVSKTNLQAQVTILTEELAALKKNYEDDRKAVKPTERGDVKVEINAAPGQDLTKILNDMRYQYEAMAEKNRRDAEDQYQSLVNKLKGEIQHRELIFMENKSQITELRRTLQSLEIELQAQLATKKSLESALAETEGRYCVKLSQIQITIASIEEQLSHLKDESECQKSQYDQLLDIKTKLEQEIAKYRSLLDEGDKNIPEPTIRTTTGSSRIASATTTRAAKP